MQVFLCIHATTVLQPFFRNYPGEAVAGENLLLGFIVPGEISEADTPTIRLTATPCGLISNPPPSSPSHVTLDALPAATLPFILAWHRHQICWLAYPVAWLSCIMAVKRWW